MPYSPPPGADPEAQARPVAAVHDALIPSATKEGGWAGAAPSLVTATAEGSRAVWRVGHLAAPGGRSGRLAGHEGVAVHLERPGFVLSSGTAEGVDRRSDLDGFEAGVLEHFLPARTGQPASDSTGPQVDVPQRPRRHWPAVGDVGELQHPAGAQDPPDLGKDCLLVGA
jgi:hypothetical protein